MNVSRSAAGLSLWPQSKIGAIGSGLTMLFLLALGLNLWTSNDGRQNAFLVFMTFVTALGALAGLILAALAIVRQHERSVLVYLALMVDVLVGAFLAVEILTGV